MPNHCPLTFWSCGAPCGPRFEGVCRTDHDSLNLVVSEFIRSKFELLQWYISEYPEEKDVARSTGAANPNHFAPVFAVIHPAPILSAIII